MCSKSTPEIGGYPSLVATNGMYVFYMIYVAMYIAMWKPCGHVIFCKRDTIEDALNNSVLYKSCFIGGSTNSVAIHKH